VDRLRGLAAEYPGLSAVIEKVGYWMPGDHPSSACTFARHCGHLEAACYALGIPVLASPTPQTWMKRLGTLPGEKPARKRAIRELMARRFPHLTVTLSTSDALALLAVHETIGSSQQKEQT